MTVTINGTTGIAGVDGSAATPAVQGGDANTGVFYPVADTVAISTGGTERMRVSNAGVALNGSTSGSVTLTAPAIAGTTTLTLPAVTGTISLAANTMQVFTSGSGTYTTPTGCKAILIELVGAGGGAGGGQATYNIVGAPGTAGGNTTFSTLTGGGGPGGTVSAVNPGGGSASGGDVNILGGSGGCSNLQTAGTNGNSGGNSFFGGGGGAGGDGQPGGTPGTNSGGGGASSSTSVATKVAGGGGSAGGYVRKLIANPSATYSYAVGAGGAVGTSVAPFGVSSAGAAGIIIVTEYY